MKRLAVFGLLIWCIFIVWCNNQKLWEWESFYNEDLIIAWVGSEVSFEPTVEEWTLVLKWYFEDHSDHVFLPAGIWEDMFIDEADYLPWNTVKFKWIVQFLDWAAGNHYYEVKSIDKLDVRENRRSMIYSIHIITVNQIQIVVILCENAHCDVMLY